jgi:cytochrome c556
MAGRWSLGALVAIAVGTGAAVASAYAHPGHAAKAVAVRQAHFDTQGKTFKAITDEVKKDQPDMATLTQDAARLEDLANNLPSWFPKGSGPQAGVKTAAKAEIWSDPDGFAGAADRFQVAASKLNQAAKIGDLATVKAEVRDVGGACAACHAKFREKKTS